MEDYSEENGPRPEECCGVCPPIVSGGYDCTCKGNPRCRGVVKSLEESPCEAFAWVGQSPMYCDNCGEPYWEHSHKYGVGAEVGTLRPITPEDAARVREKWDPNSFDQDGGE